MAPEEISEGPVLKAVARKLASASDSPWMDAQTLLAAITGKPPAWLVAHPEFELNPDQASTVQDALCRLAAGTPLPYVIGRWEFYGLQFSVGPDVLIPRPETEMLVEEALRWLGDRPNQRQVIDVGTGSGCIAVALAHSLPNLHLLATDISAAALQVARVNIHRYHLEENIHLIQADLLAPIGRPHDLVVANLPYIPTSTLHRLPVYNHEPEMALNGGVDGLDLIRQMLHQARSRLAMGGAILAEIEAGQAEGVRADAQGVFPEAEIRVLRDLAGLDRMVVIQLPEGAR